jgi:hypothetical protein
MEDADCPKVAEDAPKMALMLEFRLVFIKAKMENPYIH